MDSSIGKCLFQKRNERIDWRKLAAVDVERIAREVDVDAIQDNILNVTYCNVEHELGYHGLDANVIKLFRLAQLTIEYLLHSQEFLQQCLSDKDQKLESFNEQLNESLSQCGGVKDELSKRNDAYKNLKKELQKSKKLIGDYQLMVRAGSTGLHRCTSCTKSFISEYYLQSHIERRHPSEVKRCVPQQQTHNVSTLQDETLQNELEEIKSRLKATEDELKREHDNVYQLTLKENVRNQDFADILKQNELWKNEEEEQIKVEMEGYKRMMIKELRDTQQENIELKENLYNLQMKTEQWQQTTLGNLEDNETYVSKVQSETFLKQIEDLAEQLGEKTMENGELRKTMSTLEARNLKLQENFEKYNDLERRFNSLESYFTNELEKIQNKYHLELEKEKRLCELYIEKEKERISMNIPETLDVVDTKPVTKSPRIFDIDTDSMTLWVSSNTSVMNCYKLSKNTASSKGEWSDLFSFRALPVQVDMFDKAIHVYSCGGSPYWRQYISLSDQPPSPNYKREFTFYVSDTKIAGTLKFFILDTGSGTVIRSMISRKDAQTGWREKDAYFYALKANASLNRSLNRSGTFNSDMFRSVSDDEVSLSSLTGTDVVKGNLADEIKMSRENLVAVSDPVVEVKSTDEVFNMESESESESEKMDEVKVDEPEKMNESAKFFGTSSSSFLGSTLPEKGQYYPFPDNPLAVSRYNHSEKMVTAQREEMLKILEDNMIKRGVDLDNDGMPLNVFQSKMRNHDKELKLVFKQYPGCDETRKRLLKSIDDFTSDHFSKKKKGNLGAKWNSANAMVKAAVRFSDDVTPIKRPADIHATSNRSNSSPYHDTSTPNAKEYHMNINSQPIYNREEDVDDLSDSSSDSWNSEELENQNIKVLKDQPVDGNTSVNKGTPNMNNQQISQQAVSATKQQPVSEGKDGGDLSDSSWDSDDLSIKHLQNDSQQVINSFEERDFYNPKMRPPTGEKVKDLSASLELTLGSRDRSKKKPAGGVNMHDFNGN